MGTADDEPAALGPRGPAHADRPLPRLSRLAATAGIAAAVAAIGLGTASLLKLPAPAPDIGPTLQPITVSAAPTIAIPLSVPELLALLEQAPDFGPLSDPQRRASCLAGLGYSASTTVLGAQPIAAGGQPGVLLMLPGSETDTVLALVVAPNCSSADTGLFADTTVRRP